MSSGSPARGSAVVIGGSFAGLLAAGVLARHCRRVTVIERQSDPGTSHGAVLGPQAYHAHSLMLRGKEVLEELVPGILAELAAAGSQPLDFARDCRFYHFGIYKPRFESELVGLVQTRPLLESILRKRVVSLPNVRVEYGSKVMGLSCNETGNRVRGVSMVRRGDGVRRKLAADLVVDAAGRGSRTPRWLVRLGLPAPRASAVRLDLCYASRFYQPPPRREVKWSALFVYPRPPDEYRAGYIMPAEGGRWLVSLAGYFGHHGHGDGPGFLRFALRLPVADLARAIEAARPLSPIRSFRFARQTRHHYEELRDMPGGLIVLGDAFCSLDPLFGQGMTLAALQAKMLGRLLRDSPTGSHGRAWRGLTRDFHRAAARTVQVPWLLTASEAFRYPQATGNRPALTPFLQQYAAHVFELSANDPEIYDRFLKHMHLRKGISSLFHPRLARRVAVRAVFQVLAKAYA